MLEIKSNTKSTQSGKINITQAKTSHLDQWQNSTLLLYFIYSICVAFYCLYYMQHFFWIFSVLCHSCWKIHLILIWYIFCGTSNGSFCVCAQSLKQKAWAPKEILYWFQDLSRQLMQRKPHYVELACEANLISLISLDFVFFRLHLF